MLLALCACGGNANEPAPAAAATPAPAADTPAPADNANEPATQPDDVPVETTFTTVEPGKLHMSTNASFPPYEMTTDDGGFEGIDVEVATAIAKKLGLGEFRRVAQENGCMFLSAADCGAEFNQIDFMHLTKRGHAKLAEGIYEFVKDKI